MAAWTSGKTDVLDSFLGSFRTQNVDGINNGVAQGNQQSLKQKITFISSRIDSIFGSSSTVQPVSFYVLTIVRT